MAIVTCKEAEPIGAYLGFGAEINGLYCAADNVDIIEGFHTQHPIHAYLVPMIPVKATLAYEYFF